MQLLIVITGKVITGRELFILQLLTDLSVVTNKRHLNILYIVYII